MWSFSTFLDELTKIAAVEPRRHNTQRQDDLIGGGMATGAGVGAGFGGLGGAVGGYKALRGAGRLPAMLGGLAGGTFGAGMGAGTGGLLGGVAGKALGGWKSKGRQWTPEETERSDMEDQILDAYSGGDKDKGSQLNKEYAKRYGKPLQSEPYSLY